MTKCDNPDLPPNKIVGATAECLVVEIDSKRRSAPWAAVKSVYASIAKRDDDMPIMAFEINEGQAVRSLLVGQVDPVLGRIEGRVAHWIAGGSSGGGMGTSPRRSADGAARVPPE